MIIRLPKKNDTTYEYQIPEQKSFSTSKGPFNRIAFAAAHVVPVKGSKTEVDWDATIAYRKRLWSFGLGVAEAMDTAQRGMGLSYENAKELIKRSIEASKKIDGAFLASGCGTDQLEPSADLELEDVIAAYKEQVEYVEGLDGKV
ncbi:MAG: DUF993 family protein, partial [Bacteroidia bacterium]